ncbi:MAG: aminofutalosine synthase MqnE [Flavobacteriales bacterium]|nr:aminofutalosine synthase MqnE [Flavobacteriales bacterium]|tara:strand:- start:30998 stop:32155 length:1158 start_codon:yes stop_codon:yes gene_type:complete
MNLDLILQSDMPQIYHRIAEKVFNGERISEEEGIALFDKAASLNYLGSLANYIREKKHGDNTYFNKNFHIEPTNICVFDCKFCAYSKLIRQKTDYDAWEMSEEEIIEKVRSYDNSDITEVHIVGGVHPKMGLHYFANLIKKVKEIRPELHVKAFTAVELEYMCRKAKVSYREGLQILKDHGQNSLPGGGAEIFAEDIRAEICNDKCSSEQWLEIHQTAHEIGMPSNATMLYGHIEEPKHLVDHMNRLRNLQDKTGGFNTFIPLKFRNGNNQMSHIEEVSVLEDLRMYAIARIYMDNFPHLKAYWPMIGRQTAQLTLNYGVDDIDGTIDDSTKIYSMAGAEEQSPTLTTEELVALIKDVGRKPIERDSVYNVLKDYSEVNFDAVEA